jgi:ribosomal-protein-alanine N-acetyltransferase
MWRVANFLRREKRLEIMPLRADALARCVAMHAASFHRGWDETEFRALLADPTVVSAAAVDGRSGRLLSFVLSRRALDEAEILTIVVDRAARGAGVGGRLLADHMARLKAGGVRALFLEVDAGNKAALALYARAGFVKVGERKGYYATGAGPAATALILRADL